jgi:hypothetical protein
MLLMMTKTSTSKAEKHHEDDYARCPGRSADGYSCNCAY